jgi:hypothetical protein
MIYPKFKVGDSVRVVSLPDAIRAVAGPKRPKPNEVATVRHIVHTPNAVAYIVESLTPSGDFNWLCEFYDGEIEAAS